jgi:hypothetical protein
VVDGGGVDLGGLGGLRWWGGRRRLGSGEGAWVDGGGLDPDGWRLGSDDLGEGGRRWAGRNGRLEHPIVNDGFKSYQRILDEPESLLKKLMEWKVSEVIEFDFCIKFLMNNTDFFGEQCQFFRN